MSAALLLLAVFSLSACAAESIPPSSPSADAASIPVVNGESGVPSRSAGDAYHKISAQEAKQKMDKGGIADWPYDTTTEAAP